MDRHDPVTVNIMHAYGDQIQARANGAEAHESLQAALDAYRTVPLDESCGEGYHRSITHENQRATHVTSMHLKQSNRRRHALAHVRRFQLKYGKLGSQVVRFEWFNWKRLFQCVGKRKWRPVQKSAREVLKRTYREDETANVDWRCAVGYEPDAGSGCCEQTSQIDACRIEHLLAQVKRGEQYSIPAVPGDDDRDEEVAGAAGVGAGVSEPGRLHFQIIEVVDAQHRPHLMPTIHTDDDLSRTSALAFQVQWHRTFRREASASSPPEGCVEVFPDGDLEWVKPFSLAPFSVYAHSLIRYDTVTPSPSPLCVYLSDARPARVTIPIMDQKCPVLAVIGHLRGQGWRAGNRPMVHTTESELVYDAVEAPKFRSYFQCLCVIERTLPLTSRLPSRQAIGY